MPTYLLTVQLGDVRNGYFFFDRRWSEFHECPALGAIRKGSRLEFVRADGRRTQSDVIDVRAVDEGEPDRSDDGTWYTIVDNNPMTRVRLSPLQTDRDAPPGTQVWLLDEPAVWPSNRFISAPFVLKRSSGAKPLSRMSQNVFAEKDSLPSCPEMSGFGRLRKEVVVSV